MRTEKNIIKRLLAQKTLERFSRDAEKRRSGKADEEDEAIVDKAIKESRQEHSGR